MPILFVSIFLVFVFIFIFVFIVHSLSNHPQDTQFMPVLRFVLTALIHKTHHS